MGRMLEGEDPVGVRDQVKSESVRTKRPIDDARFWEMVAAVLAPSAT